MVATPGYTVTVLKLDSTAVGWQSPTLELTCYETLSNFQFTMHCSVS